MNRPLAHEPADLQPVIEAERYEFFEEPRYRFDLAPLDLARRDFMKVLGGGIAVCLLLSESEAFQQPGGRGRGGAAPGGGAQEIGAWLQRYGVSIYGTRKGPVPPQAWGATTRKDTTVYVHVLDGAAMSVTLTEALGSVARATMLSTDERVETRQISGGLTITLPHAATTDIDRVVVLRLGRDQGKD